MEMGYIIRYDYDFTRIRTLPWESRVTEGIAVDDALREGTPDSAAEGVRADGANVKYLPPLSEGAKAMRALRKPKNYPTPADLQRALGVYLDSLQSPDGSWIKAPTLSGAGIFLGFNSRSWHEPYSKDQAFKPTIDWLKFYVETWREEQVQMPSKGVYPQGLMYLMNRLDAREAAEHAREVSIDGASRAITPPARLKDLLRPADHGAPAEDEHRNRAQVELDKLSRMSALERVIWHKAKQIEAEAAIDRAKDEATS